MFFSSNDFLPYFTLFALGFRVIIGGREAEYLPLSPASGGSTAEGVAALFSLSVGPGGQLNDQ